MRGGRGSLRAVSAVGDVVNGKWQLYLTPEVVVVISPAQHRSKVRTLTYQRGDSDYN